MSIFEFLTKVQRLQTDYLWSIPVNIKWFDDIIVIEAGEFEVRKKWYVRKSDSDSEISESFLQICEHISTIRDARI